MIILIKLIFSLNLIACDFKSKLPVYSLSNLTSIIFNDIGLLKSVRAVSYFSSIHDQNVKRIHGGIYLSQKEISSWGSAVVFYDESQELSSKFKIHSSLKTREIKTRSRNYHQILREQQQLLLEFTQGCESRIMIQFSHYEELIQKVHERYKKRSPLVFFLGPANFDRYPELIIGDDGLVGDLVREKIIRSYPSMMSYIPWSKKIIQSLPKETIFISLVDTHSKPSSTLREVKPLFYEFSYPGILSPGPSQARGFLILADKLFLR